MLRFKPEIVFLMEVMTSMEIMERIKCRMNFEGIFFTEGLNHGGGITLLWKGKDLVRLLGYSHNHVDVEVQSSNLPRWRFTSFYGYPECHRRKESWQLLNSLKRRSNLPWCCIRDFNNFIAQKEREEFPIIFIH